MLLSITELFKINSLPEATFATKDAPLIVVSFMVTVVFSVVSVISKPLLPLKLIIEFSLLTPFIVKLPIAVTPASEIAVYSEVGVPVKLKLRSFTTSSESVIDWFIRARVSFS